MSPAVGTTKLPDEDQPALGNGVEDEVAVDRESAVSDYGDVRIQIRETGAPSWDSSAEGFGEFIGNFDTLAMEFVGREDGERYEVRARTETEHVTGAWTDPVAITTVFPGATNLEVIDVTTTSMTIRWQDNADNESGTEIWLREELDPLVDSGYGDWEFVETLDATDGTGTVEYTFDDLDPNHGYEVYVKPFTEHTSATSSTASTTTEVLVPDAGWYVVLEADDGDRGTVSEERIDQERPSIEPEESSVGRWTLDITPDDRLRNWLRSEAFIYFDGEIWMRGPFTQYRPQGGSSSAAAQLRGLDHLQHLKSGGLAFGVQSEPGYEALQRFASNHLPDWAVDVTAPASTTIDEELTVYDPDTQAEYEQAFGATESGDVWELSNAELKPRQVAYTRDLLGDRTGAEGSWGFDDGDEYTSGQAMLLGGAGAAVEVQVTPDHDIPAEHVGIQIRGTTPDDGEHVDISYLWDGTEIDNNTALFIGFRWTNIGEGFYATGSGYEERVGNDLQAGETHTIRVEKNTDPGTWIGDIVTVYDQRHVPDDFEGEGWDAVHEPGGQLNGPPDYRPVDVETEPFSQEYNVTAAHIAAAVDDPDGALRLQATNDGGTTWLPNDGSEQDTGSVVADFGAEETYGTEVRARATLGGHGTRNDQTPRLGYQPQTLSEFELSIDTNALRVIDDQTYTGSPSSIISDIAEDSGMVYVGDAREDQLALEAFAPGDVVVDPDWTVEDADPADTTEGYYNSVTVFGPEGDDGERLSATAASQAEVDAVGEVEGEAEFRPDATTEAELVSIARTLLAEGIAKDTVTGTLEIAPQLVQPGYAYRVDEFEQFDERESPAYVLQRGSFSWGTMSLDFEGRSLVTAIRSIETEVSTVKRAL